MAKDPFEQFVIPDQLRAFAEQSVAQARKAFEGFIDAANQAVGQMQDRAEAAHGGAGEIRRSRCTMPSRTSPRRSISPKS